MLLGGLALLLIACGGSSEPKAVAVSPSPAASPTPVSLLYRNGIRPLVDQYTRDIALLQGLTSKPALTNQDWLTSVDRAATNLKAEGNQVRNLVPPACLAQAHESLVTGTRTLEDGLDALSKGLADRNTVRLTEAEALLNSGPRTINQAIDRINATAC